MVVSEQLDMNKIDQTWIAGNYRITTQTVVRKYKNKWSYQDRRQLSIWAPDESDNTQTIILEYHKNQI